MNQNCVALQGESPPSHPVKGREGGVLQEECGTPSRHVGVGVARGRLLNELQSRETGRERQGGSRSDVKDGGVGLLCKEEVMEEEEENKEEEEEVEEEEEEEEEEEMECGGLVQLDSGGGEEGEGREYGVRVQRDMTIAEGVEVAEHMSVASSGGSGCGQAWNGTGTGNAEVGDSESMEDSRETTEEGEATEGGGGRRKAGEMALLNSTSVSVGGQDQLLNSREQSRPVSPPPLLGIPEAKRIRLSPSVEDDSRSSTPSRLSCDEAMEVGSGEVPGGGEHGGQLTPDLSKLANKSQVGGSSPAAKGSVQTGASVGEMAGLSSSIRPVCLWGGCMR